MRSSATVTKAWTRSPKTGHGYATAAASTTPGLASMVEGNAFGVSLLGVGQADVARRFARKGRDKTADFRFDQGIVVKVPLVPQAVAHIECRTDQIFISGDHAIVVGLIEGVETIDGPPLLYFARQYGSFVALADI
jgi:flavin reductase (DIM6/NTAB) family NADH-FMN oxidoreductase RutF